MRVLFEMRVFRDRRDSLQENIKDHSIDRVVNGMYSLAFITGGAVAIYNLSPPTSYLMFASAYFAAFAFAKKADHQTRKIDQLKYKLGNLESSVS